MCETAERMRAYFGGSVRRVQPQVALAGARWKMNLVCGLFASLVSAFVYSLREVSESELKFQFRWAFFCLTDRAYNLEM